MPVDNEKITDILNDCNAIKGFATALNDGLRTSIVDLGAKIEQDNYGTRSNKDGALSSLIDSVDVINEVQDMDDLIVNILKNIK